MKIDLDRQLQELDRVSVPDQWERIEHGEPRVPNRSSHHAARFAAAVVIVALFVGAITWAGLSIRDDGTSAAWHSFGSPSSTGWTINYPSDWHVQQLKGCGGQGNAAGAVFTNTTFTFRNPKGGAPGCGDRMVFAGFPPDGVAVALQPEADLASIVIPTPSTPFPIRMAQLANPGGIVGGPRERYLDVQVPGRQNTFLSTFAGPHATSAARTAIVRMVASLSVPGATRWSPSEVARAEGVAVTAPSDWHVTVHDGTGLLITSYAPSSTHDCSVPGPNALGGMRYADAMIWVPFNGSTFQNVPSVSFSAANAGPMHRGLRCGRSGFSGPAEWRDYYESIQPFGGAYEPIEVVYGENALREDTGRIVSLILRSLRFGGAPASPEPLAPENP